MSTEVTTVEQQAPETMYLLAKAEIDMQIATARAFPRSIKHFHDKAMSLATVNMDVAASCKYSVPRSGKSIEGPSVRLAEIVAATYGNIRVAARIIANDGKTITAQGVCHDLETNNSTNVEVKRRITGKDGKTFSEDMQVVIGNAACAIARRNAIFATVPFALIQPIYDRAKEVAKGTVETLPARRDKAIAYFKGLGITEAQICETLEIRNVADIDLDHLSTLLGFVSAIKNEGMGAKDLFAKPGSQATPEETASAAKNKADKLTGKAKNEKIAELKARLEMLAPDDEQRGFIEMELEELEGKKK